ncbi:MAG: hypothetical protein LBM20_06040 [Rikenellaceae bacterium]|nr:hypothetical protein [Rikenellaceae bacterium]
MKKIITMVACSMFALIALSSCSTVSRTGITTPFASTEVHPNEIVANLDLDTSNKIEVTVSVSYFLGIKMSGGREYAEVANSGKSIFGGRGRKIRSMVMAKALRKGDYDMIINPQYVTVVNTHPLGSTYTVTMTGYGAKIKELYQVDTPFQIQDISLTEK